MFRRPSGDGTARTTPDAAEQRVADAARLRGLVDAVVRATDGTRRDDARLETYADMLLARAAPSDPDEVLEAALEVLRSSLERVRSSGWPEKDVLRLVERTIGEVHLRTVGALPVGRGVRLASVLGLAALLTRAPLLQATALVDADDTVGAGRRPSVEHPRLARIRGLLAKAESTPYPEEAELLSAKAQELVARYALDGLLDEARDDGAGPRAQVRRLWLDTPYVDAKAALVAAVAHANRCRAAVAAPLGFCLVVGDARDLTATEILATSLLVQAGAAMLDHERRTSGTPASGRTRSFRRAFLLSYAQRVGERLVEASADAYREAGGDALPVLAAQEERVSAAFEAAVPHTVSRRSTVSNGDGWSAGRVAADRARLDVADQLGEA